MTAIDHERLAAQTAWVREQSIKAGGWPAAEDRATGDRRSSRRASIGRRISDLVALIRRHDERD